jgi:hypothetical protein
MPTAPAELKTIEAWAAAKRTPDFIFAIAKLTTPGWGVGREVTEVAFDAAVLAAGSLQIRPS